MTTLTLPQTQPRHLWACPELAPDVQVRAHTAGEARAALKRHLGLRRLPAGIKPRIVGRAAS